MEEKPTIHDGMGKRLSLSDFPLHIQKSVYKILLNAAIRKEEREADKKKPTA